MIKKMYLGDLRTEPVFAKIEQLVSQHNIYLFLSKNNVLEYVGSGTLCTFIGLKGIITAAHVLQPICKKISEYEKAIYIRHSITATDYTKITWDRVKSLDDWELLDPRSGWSEKNLDIAFIELGDEVFANLINENKKCAVDIDAFIKTYNLNPSEFNNTSNYNNWIWAISGVTKEDFDLFTNEKRTIKNETFLGGPDKIIRCKLKRTARIFTKYKNAQTDLIVIPIKGTEDVLPFFYNCLSGAGVWQIRLNENLEIAELFFCGVFVAASEKKSKLYARGHISLYSVFCKFLEDLKHSSNTNELSNKTI